METKNTWETYDEKQLQEVDDFARDYMDFLDNGKTERECIDTIVNRIEKEGYQELEALIKSGKKLQCGDKVYSVQIGKTALFIKRILLYVKTRGVDMRPQNVQAFRHRLFPDPEHHDGFVHPDRIYFIAAL